MWIVLALIAGFGLGKLDSIRQLKRCFTHLTEAERAEFRRLAAKWEN